MYASMGWDKLREQRFEKQKELGFWDSNMTLPDRYPPNQPWDTLSKDQKAYAAKVLAVHSTMIEEADKSIGKMIQYLKDIGEYDNTFIMFTSDNGTSEPVNMVDFKYAHGVDLAHAKQFVALQNNSLQNLGKPNSDFNYGPWGSYVAASPLSGFKSSFYEGDTRVPLVVKEPQASPASAPGSNQTLPSSAGKNMIKSLVFVQDITPTILAYANVSHPAAYKGHEVHPMMGKSLKPLLEGKVDKVYADNEPVAFELFNQTSVRMGDWVGIHDSTDKTGVWKLFNLRNDLGQNRNISDQHPEVVQKMKTAYEKYAQDVGLVIPRGAAFAKTLTNLFPAVNATNAQTISLADMFAPGYEHELKPNIPPD
jgi:arylsulfatase A-like enzyme